MRLFNIPANYNFLESLYSFIDEKFGDLQKELGDLTVLLPSRRSCNELKRIFLANSRNKVNVLPRIKAIGDVDYDDFLMNGLNYDLLKKFSDITKPVSPIKYKLLLISSLLREMKNIHLQQAINLSQELNTFLEEVEKHGLSLDNLDDLVDEEYAAHWQKILLFLRKFGSSWKSFLEENNITSPSSYRLQQLELHSQFFRNTAPTAPIILAGNFGDVAITTELIKTLAKYDNTYFVFKGFDDNRDLREVDEFNLFFSFRKLLTALKIDSKTIEDITYKEHRVLSDEIKNTIYKSALPANLTHLWSRVECSKLDNIKLFECKDSYEEVNVITLNILKYISQKGMCNMAVIADKSFAASLELSLKRYNLPVNNAFGNAFIEEETVKYLLLTIAVFASNFDGVLLLSLLKHHFSLFGYEREKLENIVKIFEDKLLRGKVNRDGLQSFRNNLESIRETDRHLAEELIDRIETYFEPLTKALTLEEMLKAHLEVAEAIASAGDTQGNKVLWKNDHIVAFFRDFTANADVFGTITADDYFLLLQHLMGEQSYSDEYSQYPAVNIISPLEARLINYDLVIFSNLNDGKYPANVATDPWMSRAMRAKFGLPSKNASIGSGYYDFIQLITQKNVVLTRSLKEEGSPSIKSRFLLRLETLLKSKDLGLETDEEIAGAFGYLTSVSGVGHKLHRPNPTPPLAIRPRKLSATNIDILKSNPYDIYAKYILKLRPKDEIENQNHAILFGNAVHKCLEDFCIEYIKCGDREKKLQLLETAEERFKIQFFDTFLNIFGYDNVAVALFFPRFVNIFKYFLPKCKEMIDCKILVEQEGEFKFEKENFVITAKSDRLDIMNNRAVIIDYKTAEPPSATDVVMGRKLQLSIEALIAIRGGYGIDIGEVEALEYWKLSGRESDNFIEITHIPSQRGAAKDISIESILKNLEQFLKLELIDYFDEESNGYIATNRNKYSDYRHLSRVEEWLYNS